MGRVCAVGRVCVAGRAAVMSSRVAGVVLAAGASRRVGLPKALATLAGRTFLDLACGLLLEAGCSEVVVVTAEPYGERIRAAIKGGVMCLQNPEPERGMSGSLVVALRAPQIASYDAVAVALVDHPRVQSATLRALLERWRATRAGVVRPRCGGRGGHPYVLDSRLFPELIALPPGSDPRPLFDAHALCVEVEDAGVLEDIDQLSELVALGAEVPRA